MKRYTIAAAYGIYAGSIDIEEDQYGEWVKWEEVKEAINSSSPRRYLECNHTWTRVGAVEDGYQFCRNCGAREYDKP